MIDTKGYANNWNCQKYITAPSRASKRKWKLSQRFTRKNTRIYVNIYIYTYRQVRVSRWNDRMYSMLGFVSKGVVWMYSDAYLRAYGLRPPVDVCTSDTTTSFNNVRSSLLSFLGWHSTCNNAINLDGLVIFFWGVKYCSCANESSARVLLIRLLMRIEVVGTRKSYLIASNYFPPATKTSQEK